MYYICRIDLYRDKLDFDDYDYVELELQIVLHYLVDAKRGALELMLLCFLISRQCQAEILLCCCVIVEY